MNIYVGNLSYNTDDAALRAAFADFGNIESASVIMDRDSGRSKGFGFVEMTNNAEGQQAIEKLNGFELDGRELKVNEARPRENKPKGGGGSRW